MISSATTSSGMSASPRGSASSRTRAKSKASVLKTINGIQRGESHPLEDVAQASSVMNTKTFFPPWLQHWRRVIYCVFEEPDSSLMAQTLSLIIVIFIVLSIASFILETVPELEESGQVVWDTIEVASTVVFTAEFAIRFFVCDAFGDPVWTFVKNPFNAFDLLAILPFYLELSLSTAGLSGLRLVRVVRLSRVFRIFKLSRYSNGMQLFAETLRRSAEPLMLLIFFVAIAVILFSSAMFFAEKNSDSDSSAAFESIPVAFWWCIVSITTVGYGDYVPTTFAGRAVASITVLCGILIIALPVAIVGNKFQEVFSEQQESSSLDQVEKDLLAVSEMYNLNPDTIDTFTFRLEQIRGLGAKMKHITDQQAAVTRALVQDCHRLLSDLKVSAKDAGRLKSLRSFKMSQPQFTRSKRRLTRSTTQVRASDLQKIVVEEMEKSTPTSSISANTPNIAEEGHLMHAAHPTSLCLDDIPTTSNAPDTARNSFTAENSICVTEF
eukprot:GILI01020192.1.p1 GENE.GILI01020192.1~~GILI01020192.1.p1  ORF type:complete len:496 (-),score=47.88 GILI01020192.1:350-1837(-)